MESIHLQPSTNTKMESVPITQVNCRLSSYRKQIRHNLLLNKVISNFPADWVVCQIVFEKCFNLSRKQWSFVLKIQVHWDVHAATTPWEQTNTSFTFQFNFSFWRSKRKFWQHIYTLCSGVAAHLTNEDAAVLFHESHGLPLMYIWTHCPQNVLYRLPLDLIHTIVDFI